MGSPRISNQGIAKCHCRTFRFDKILGSCNWSSNSTIAEETIYLGALSGGLYRTETITKLKFAGWTGSVIGYRRFGTFCHGNSIGRYRDKALGTTVPSAEDQDKDEV